MRKIKIHFVCLGNAYRSRLAEAYAKSLNLKGFEFSSSGVAAHLFEQRKPYYADLLAKNHMLLRFLSATQVQTSSKLLDEQDMIIFMHPDVLEQAKKEYQINMFKVHCWNIDDLWQICLERKVSESDLDKTVKLAEETFQKIKRDVDRLASQITKSSWVDVINSDNQDVGYAQSLDTANKKGLWHRSVHAMIRLPDGRYVVEKRSNKIIFAPGLLDITVGGSLDPGETPEQAAIREIKEEINVEIRPDQLKLLNITKGSHYRPKYNRYSRGFSYNYFVQLEPGQGLLKPQQSEVAQLMLATHPQAKKLVRNHRLKHFGRLNYAYKLYRDNLKLAEELA
ncbi:MAG TPA: NUDIX domain-containing protein [Candidatus Saccharimonadales bacterium]|nr:NUDIX domain-containing protein [Candidatus Saccharimonadales bacterium]